MPDYFSYANEIYILIHILKLTARLILKFVKPNITTPLQTIGQSVFQHLKHIVFGTLNIDKYSVFASKGIWGNHSVL